MHPFFPFVCSYYWNEVTKESQWDKPIYLSWIRVAHIPGITDREEAEDEAQVVEDDVLTMEKEESTDREL